MSEPYDDSDLWERIRDLERANEEKEKLFDIIVQGCLPGLVGRQVRVEFRPSLHKEFENLQLPRDEWEKFSHDRIDVAAVVGVTPQGRLTLQKENGPTFEVELKDIEEVCK